MVMIMDMTIGRRRDDSDVYGDEVLNANWLPQAQLQLGLQSVAESVVAERQVRPAEDPDVFLRRLYCAQE